MKILLVEDEEPLREVLAYYIISELKFKVVCAASFDEGVKKLHDHFGFDLMITDNDLGEGRKGIDLISLVRSPGSPQPNIRCLLCTGRLSQDEMGPLAREVKADGYLSKPFPLETLHQEIERLIPSKPQPA